MGIIGPQELAFLGLLGVFLVAMAFWLWMLVDCIQYEPDDGNSKMIWVIIICVTGALGATFYFFMKRCNRA